MKKVFQQIVDKDRGDCMRASVASILELPLEAVPNFTDLSTGSIGNWFHVFTDFFFRFGYEFEYNLTKPSLKEIQESDDIDGYYLAVVKSLNIEDRTHMIIINKAGFVVHDPSTRKNYTGTRPDIISIYKFKKRDMT